MSLKKKLQEKEKTRNNQLKMCLSIFCLSPEIYLCFIHFSKKAEVPVIGVIENMTDSVFDPKANGAKVNSIDVKYNL